MKKIFLFFLLLTSMSSFAAYYVAGNGVAGNPWCGGKSWDPAGSQMTQSGSNYTITFTAVPVGSYQFKVTNGSWNTNYGFTSFDEAASNIYATGNNDGNVCFNLQEAQDVTIVFTSGQKIQLNGSKGNEGPDPALYDKVGVPSEYEGVMLQAFYWDSYTKTKYMKTSWTNLATKADEISNSFSLVWCPPAGNGGGVGYYTKTYSNLTSDWGSKASLKALVAALKAGGTLCLADIVINHRQSSSGWAKSFTAENFEGFGKFQITSEHICSNDEAFMDSSSDSRSLPHGASDTGDNDGGCRDLDHTHSYVQAYCEAYVKWMIDSIGFGGFRYDMVKGYSGQYLSQYNLASEPFFSVGEYWDGSTGALKTYLESTYRNTTVFDFAMKYAYNSFGKGNFTALKGAGMRGAGLSKYAVTFIDNHDTFERNDNQNDEFVGYNVTLTAKEKKIIQANAHLLMMPGTPCVFWPHWYTFQAKIDQLVAIRHQAGIHSESLVSNETASTTAYSATITGHKGIVILRMGADRDRTAPAGYQSVLEDATNEISIFLQPTSSAVEGIMEQPASPARKVLIDGKLYIDRAGKRYSTNGQTL